MTSARVLYFSFLSGVYTCSSLLFSTPPAEMPLAEAIMWWPMGAASGGFSLETFEWRRLRRENEREKRTSCQDGRVD